MSEFKGTPGPWRFDENTTFSGDPIFYVSQDENAKYTPNYSDVSQTCCGENKDIQKANAHLIAAAPELLEALQDFMAESSGNAKSCGHDFECICRFDKSRAAIAKALGK
ncbi:TPA: hypothetical protein MDG15_000070 [Citrobacter freundii]|jgi:hypothetical protein|nr:hypothetical protein [Citrobacter freundii]HBN5497858.1 hypothetical protein [Citrobacter freundii]HBU9121859.1 hypothetical protein [Citrobacter freundii]